MASSDAVTLAITHNIRAGYQQDYERWLQRIIPIAEQTQGHLGVNVIRPSGSDTTYNILIHFDSLDHLYHWTQSEQRKQLMLEIQDILSGEDRLEVRPGAEFWFTPIQESVSQPPFWKQFIISIAVIFPSTNFVP